MARDPRTQRVEDNLNALISGAVRALTLEVAANLTAAAPVDTGHFRRNFVPSVGTPNVGTDEGAAQAQGQATMLSYKIADGPTFVTNNVPYGAQLVLGSSAQAPAGWDLAAVDRAVLTVRQQYGASIDVTASIDAGARGAGAAAGMAAAYSPFGGDE